MRLITEQGDVKFTKSSAKSIKRKIPDSEYKKMVEAVMIQYVDRNLAEREELIDMDKKQLVKMLYEIGEDVDYWKFAIDNAIFS